MTAADNLTHEDRADMLRRALQCCPDLQDNDGIVRHLHLVGIPWLSVSDIADAAIDEARAQSKEPAHV